MCILSRLDINSNTHTITPKKYYTPRKILNPAPEIRYRELDIMIQKVM
jgi:hypothetical protein